MDHSKSSIQKGVERDVNSKRWLCYRSCDMLHTASVIRSMHMDEDGLMGSPQHRLGSAKVELTLAELKQFSRFGFPCSIYDDFRYL
ncbi:unnamed protein product [Nezara viridula]|uniref:Uncharacterized protein n=1 Tax=Nezara viridula TaxID=85310 RepID=A0A9P0MVN9_NEZVI|nr:unnamed protein product [Nezara viridula]